AVITDGSGSLRVTWFNQPWIAKGLKEERAVVLAGKVEQYLGRLSMSNPEWEPLEKENLHTNRIVPVYPLTARITQRWLRQLMYPVVTHWAPRLRDPLPGSLRAAAGLIPLGEAVHQIHFPGSWEQLKAAQERLAFDEIFLLQLGVQKQKREWQQLEARRFEIPDGWLEGVFEKLPYALTGAQVRAVGDLRTDLASGHPMNRLLQGDVGSGKTAVAALGIAMVISAGAQAALMAPSSILAEQHYSTMQNLLAREDGLLEPGQIRLLLGDTTEGEKREIREALADGRIKLVIGTHALIEDPVEFQDLELVIIDEQHRFGVKQRAALRAKGTNPHLLVMTATPIPRSLALTVYGDLDLTLIDEMPPGRKPVSTHVVYPQERERVYTLLRRQVKDGRQGFIIYPLVEENETSEAKAAVEEYDRLQKEVFPDLSLGLLHGRMKGDEKEAVMDRFRANQTQVLVSTSVVEVGVDIPNASVMVIEGANRFGLAQLHQFRGRVGRGSDVAYCLLIPERDVEAENARLEAMTETTDGFVLAERDLDQRGPGDFLGTRQSGYAELKLASLTDVRLIEKARRFAQEIFKQDPDFSDPQHEDLSRAIDRFWSNGKGDIS
ncbi:MAG TPA: ATP-dependent DNA helicase RecG, partial [Anaerolineales bacterium]|nr:ATP-dependent DNA helicase RecG [Anaerolineales bacterium]